MNMESPKQRCLAHSAVHGEVDYLHEHLNLVSKRAAKYAEAFGASDEARIAGLLHDLGKYGHLFQRRLEGKERGIDHWSAGAWKALSQFELNGIAAALAIQGHHIGLQKASEDALRRMQLKTLIKNHPDNLRLSETDLKTLMKMFEEDGLNLPSQFEQTMYSWKDKASGASMLDIRMLYSTLVDADFIETEAHFKRDKDGYKRYREEGPPLDPNKALSILLDYQKKLAAQTISSGEIRRIRAILLQSCLEAADSPTGLFTLTAPTGSGKTLSMLAFALKHAERHDLRRIVFVIPYLSIIEHTAFEYQRVFKDLEDNYILEDHSLTGLRTDGVTGDMEDTEMRQRNLLAQNWDAPIIITTSVQLLESLFANHSSTCRKLHRLAKSVILFDEVQTLPIKLVVPTLATISRLAERHGSSVVFSTATQPAFTHLHEHVKKFCVHGWKPREIVSKTSDLFRNAKRTEVQWPTFNDKKTWDELAKALAKQKRVLCIVNLKRQAHYLYDELDKRKVDGLRHLSTNMCPAHRKAVLAEVHSLLENNQPCHLVSTQCIEAGVDIDFPVVYRCLGPLDAIAQAAGRCNRNGKLKNGIFNVFLPKDEQYPPGAYDQAASVTRMLLKTFNKPLDIDDPQLFREYYRQLYNIARVESLNKELCEAIMCQDFIDVAKKYRLIEQNSINVLVPYNKDIYKKLMNEVQENGLDRRWIASARPHSISLYRPKEHDPVWSYLDPVPIYKEKDRKEDWFIHLEKEHYHKQKGLVVPSNECLIA
jgi:CRISPR-associated endonuclease/helicase Cas3